MGLLAGKHVLVTGGLGFIGSHTCYALVKAGADVTIIDDLSNSFAEVLNRLSVLLGEEYSKITFKEVNITDSEGIDAAFAARKVDALVHFAAYKAVGESMYKPLDYYQNNIGGTIAIGEMMLKHGHMVFSSSCTVYGEPDKIPIDEECSLNCTTSPYARTKVMCESILQDLCSAEQDLNVCVLRYFNPVAAHPSGLMGEHPVGVPQNLMPFVQQVAAGKRPMLKVFGSDYNTRDGTTIRDYIHIMDLAEAHVAALERLVDPSKERFGWRPINIGTGCGTTVLEMVAAMEKACGHTIPKEFGPRREGDTEAVWAATDISQRELGWKARFSVDDMCRDQWNWARRYPGGYEDSVNITCTSSDNSNDSNSNTSNTNSSNEDSRGASSMPSERTITNIPLRALDAYAQETGDVCEAGVPPGPSCIVSAKPSSLCNPLDPETPRAPRSYALKVMSFEDQ